MGIGTGEIILIFLVVLIFFGAKRLPELAKSMGKAVNEFQKAKNEVFNSPPAATPPTSVAAPKDATPEPPQERPDSDPTRHV